MFNYTQTTFFMRLTAFVFLCTFLLYPNVALCCDCKDISKMEEYDNSDHIFIGEIIMVKEYSFLVKAKEYFKGAENDLFWVSMQDCSIIPVEGDIWLIFANTYINDSILISDCGWSRAFGKNIKLRTQTLPEPVSENHSQKPTVIDISYYKTLANMELYSDVNDLRIRKQFGELNNKLNSILFIIVSILVIIIFILVRRKV